ncbi:MAG TPA: CAP domain-containing protein [Solirubrobacterales bacterium]|jgi:uncharacterized protein YkwD
MSSNRHSIPVQRRLATLILVALVGTSLLLAVAALRPAPGFARGGVCKGARGNPAHHSLGELRRATLCLVNQIRHQHGLGSLHSQRKLRKAAQGHSGDMVHRDYFSHDSPGGGSIQTRIGGSGYLAGASSYQYGEVIGGGTSNLGSPKSVAKAWMNSPPHRAAILNGGFHDLGVGVVHGFPGRGNHGATFTIDFGSRN